MVIYTSDKAEFPGLPRPGWGPLQEAAALLIDISCKAELLFFAHVSSLTNRKALKKSGDLDESFKLQAQDAFEVPCFVYMDFIFCSINYAYLLLVQKE